MSPPASKRVYARKTQPILAAAEELFLRQGFAGTSMQEVATTAGVAKATLYSNFPSKEELFAAVVRSRAETSRLDLGLNDLAALSLPDALLELAVAFLLDIYSREQLELFQTVVADARRFPILGKMMMEGAFVETRRRIVSYFIDRVAAGDLTCEDPAMAAEYFTAIIKAGKHIPLVFGQPADVSPAAVRKVAQGAVSIFLNGVPHRAK